MKKPVASKGDTDALQLYNAVGQALSYWEVSEDLLMMLFRIVSPNQPLALEAYVASPRQRRNTLLKSAIAHARDKLDKAQSQKAVAAIDALQDLSKMRNEIAHGRATDYERADSGNVIRQGTYLLPSWRADEPVIRDEKFAYVAEDVRQFTRKVGAQSSVIQECMASFSQSLQFK